jgi:hypothetical protein
MLMPNNSHQEFVEDMATPICNLSQDSPHPQHDELFTYSMVDIDALSSELGIPWECSKDTPFAMTIIYISFLWNIKERTVAIPNMKKTKYLAAIVSWKACCMHTLEEVQCLHGKLMHACHVVPMGRAYLTALKSFMGVFTHSPFLPRSPPPDELEQIWIGGVLFSGTQRLSAPSQAPPPLLTSQPTLMPAQRQALVWLLVTDGELSASSPVGTQRAGTSGGLRLLASISWWPPFSPAASMTHTTGSMVTTVGWSRAGEKATARTSQPMMFSDSSTMHASVQAHTSSPDTSAAPTIRQMALPEDSMATQASSS